MIGHLTGVSWRYALNPSRFRVNFLSYHFLGYQSSTNVYYVRTDVEPGMHADHHVFEDGQVWKQADILERARDAAVEHKVRR